MTDAELSRQEWIEERIAIMVESGCPEDFAQRVAPSLWDRYQRNMPAKARGNDLEARARDGKLGG